MRGLPQATPASWGHEFVTPTHCAKSNLPFLQEVRDARNLQTKAWASEQARSYRWHEDEGREAKASCPPSSEGCHVATPHWGSARSCPIVID
jgi:hypothetical protein